MQECIRIGTERYDKNRAGNVVDQHYAPKSGVDVSVQGVLGEYAMAKLIDGSMALLNDTSLNSFETDRGDVLLSDGDEKHPKIEIKSPVTHEPAKSFPIRVPLLHMQANQETVYCLVVIVRPTNSTVTAEYRRGKRPAESTCTYTADEEGIVAEFRGFVHAQHVFANHWLRPQTRAFWCEGPLTTWDEALLSRSISGNGASV